MSTNSLDNAPLSAVPRTEVSGFREAIEHLKSGSGLQDNLTVQSNANDNDSAAGSSQYSAVLLKQPSMLNMDSMLQILGELNANNSTVELKFSKESILTRQAQVEQKHDEMIKKFQKALDKMKDAKNSNETSRILGWAGVSLALVSAAALSCTGVGAPAAVCLFASAGVMLTNQISMETGNWMVEGIGDGLVATGLSSKEDADLAANLTIMTVALLLSLGGGFAAVKHASSQGAKIATAANGANKAQGTGSAANGASQSSATANGASQSSATANGASQSSTAANAQQTANQAAQANIRANNAKLMAKKIYQYSQVSEALVTGGQSYASAETATHNKNAADRMSERKEKEGEKQNEVNFLNFAIERAQQAIKHMGEINTLVSEQIQENQKAKQAIIRHSFA